MPANELYFVVLPMVHMGDTTFGLTEQVLTLMPDKTFATEFFEDEIDTYIGLFNRRANKYLIGGHVTGYELKPEKTADGRLIVKVIQNVE